MNRVFVVLLLLVANAIVIANKKTPGTSAPARHDQPHPLVVLNRGKLPTGRDACRTDPAGTRWQINATSARAEQLL
jgi:hypothetical protein